MRYLPDLQLPDSHPNRRAAERQAVNTVIQGSASDLIKYAMLIIEKEIDKFNETTNICAKIALRPNLLLQIHDELIYEMFLSNGHCAESQTYFHEYIKIARKCMEETVRSRLNITVPLLVKISCGSNWGQLHPYTPPMPLPSTSNSSDILVACEEDGRNSVYRASRVTDDYGAQASKNSTSKRSID